MREFKGIRSEGQKTNLRKAHKSIDPAEVARLYWEEWLTAEQVAKKLDISYETVYWYLKQYSIPIRGRNWSPGTGGRSQVKGYWLVSVKGRKRKYEHRIVASQMLGRELKEGEIPHHKDGNGFNNHPLNISIEVSKSKHIMTHFKAGSNRVSLFAAYLVLALTMSKRSTCARLQTGAVVTDFNLEHVLGVGYNGNAKGLANDCDSDEEGNCGCVHSEANALIKCSSSDKDKVLFLTHSPCLNCAKLIINSGFSWVYYLKPYRKTLPLSVLHYAGIKTCPYILEDLEKFLAPPGKSTSDDTHTRGSGRRVINADIVAQVRDKMKLSSNVVSQTKTEFDSLRHKLKD